MSIIIVQVEWIIATWQFLKIKKMVIDIKKRPSVIAAYGYLGLNCKITLNFLWIAFEIWTQ